MLETFLIISLPYLIASLFALKLGFSLFSNIRKRELNRSEFLTALIFVIILTPISVKGLLENYSDVFQEGLQEEIILVIEVEDAGGNVKAYSKVISDKGVFYDPSHSIEAGGTYKISYYSKSRYMKEIDLVYE